jgi:hypothetical protein
VLVLLQRDRDVPAEVRVLPLVAGGQVEGDVERERPRLPGGDGTEVPLGRQLRHRREAGVAADADLELVVVDALHRLGAVGEVAADDDVAADGAGVEDGERLLLRLARLQVVEVEVDGGRGVGVGDVQHQGGGVDVDARRLRVGEGRPGRDDQADGDEAGGAGDGDGTDDGLAAETGGRGHYVPFLRPGKLRRVFRVLKVQSRVDLVVS